MLILPSSPKISCIDFCKIQLPVHVMVILFFFASCIICLGLSSYFCLFLYFPTSFPFRSIDLCIFIIFLPFMRSQDLFFLKSSRIFPLSLFKNSNGILSFLIDPKTVRQPRINKIIKIII